MTDIPKTVFSAVERALDEHSAWIARPNREVTKAVALAAGIAWSIVKPADLSALDERERCAKLIESYADERLTDRQNAQLHILANAIRRQESKP